MAVLRIAKMGNPILSMVAKPIDDPTAPEIRRLAADMQETLEDIGAGGLAAPQVFESKRLFIYRLIPSRIPKDSGIEPRPWTVMVNPVITPASEDTTLVWERCLSIPGLHGKVPRHPRIKIRYQTLDGEAVSHEAHGVWASLLQHECDHLDGILFPMRMTDLSLLAFNDEPGQLARDFAEHPSGIDPLYVDMVERWPGRKRWFRSVS